MTERNSSTVPAVRASPESFVLFDRQDDLAVIARIRGQALEELVYGFKQGGAMIYGLGVDGAQACKRELARIGEVIREDDIKIEREDTEFVYIKAWASRWAVSPSGSKIELDNTIEVKRQRKFITRRDGSQEPNEFYWEQGASKAMRNAILNLVPQEIQQKVIEAYKNRAKIVEAHPDDVEGCVHEYHAAFTDKDERDALVAQVQSVWREAELTVAQVKAMLRDHGLSEVLAQAKADWSSVSLAAIQDLVVRTRKETGR